MATAVFRKYSLFKGERCTFYRGSPGTSPSSWGATLKGKICSFGEQIYPLKSNPHYQNDAVNTVGAKI